MKKLDIPNYQSLIGLKINEWEIHKATETAIYDCGGDCYIYRLKRECGHSSHAAVAINQNLSLFFISESGISLTQILFE